MELTPCGYTVISIKVVDEQKASLLAVTIKNTQTEQNLVSRDTRSRDLYS